MGVTGLWQIVQPCARPIKIETLNRKRLAVDASIWIYQFLKAVRDKEGNALRNSHVVGFFRRICKLLFFGIKPVFVFDGGAPALKRQTITNRKQRREGRREDAARTASRLLAVQMQRRAEEEDQRRRDAKSRANDRVEEQVDDSNLVYVDEMHMSQQERQQTRKFRKKDAYHLPDLDVSMAEMGGPNDQRVMSLEELEAYARQFDTGEEIDVYDFNSIDFDSPFFTSLPASDRYNILNAARLRSRLRMGHSKDQLDTMFPDRMAFSRFQIERVQERNELTQRLMNINDPNGELEFGINGTGRIAGEKGREYVLVKNDGVEGGWALGVISNEGQRERPIDVDKPAPVLPKQESDDDADFEDVPIEGLNRLPKRQKTNHQASFKSKQTPGRSTNRRGPRPKRRQLPVVDPDSLFVPDVTDAQAAQQDDMDDASGTDAELFGEEEPADDDEDLQRGLAMSMEKDDVAPSAREEQGEDDEELNRAIAMSMEKDDSDDDMQDVFQQTSVKDAAPVPHGNARAIAAVLNKRAHQTAPESREVTSFGVPVLFDDSESDEDATMDLQAALAQANPLKRKADITTAQALNGSKQGSAKPDAGSATKQSSSSGPLPFAKLDLGSSILGKKKMQQRREEAEGGFINPELEPKAKPKENEPLPPWFNGDPEEDLRRQKELEDERDRRREQIKQQNYVFDNKSNRRAVLKRYETNEVIDLDAEDDETDDDGTIHTTIDLTNDEQATAGLASVRESLAVEASKGTPWDVLDQPDTGDRNEGFHQDETISAATLHFAANEQHATERPETPFDSNPVPQSENLLEEPENEELEWSDSEPPSPKPAKTTVAKPSAESETSTTSNQLEQNEPPRSPSVNFEDIDMTNPPRRSPVRTAVDDIDESIAFAAEEAVMEENNDVTVAEEFDFFSDPEEEELLKTLTLEAEEHARFASTLNNKTQAQNIADYEIELKKLRNQQKKDRRDADEVTQVMVQECQQLLRLFGLPYITAPMEAEAQCAELVQLGLVDGIVTDDSDCFLFGGTRVYKNMFNQAKFVECYLTSDMEKEFNLTRDKLISIAQLLGSDYTEGLTGVGPVTALEIISEFDTLNDFKRWLEAVQLQQITKEHDKDNPFRKKFRKSATKLMLPTAFPDSRVEMAYFNPDVDKDPEAFQWGVPDLDALRSFLMATIGWSQERTDEVLVPVIKDMNQRLDEGTQANITRFFAGGVGAGTAGDAFAPRKRDAGSKRLGNALSKMASRAKNKRAGGAAEVSTEDSASQVETQDTEGETSSGAAKKTKKKPTQRKTKSSSVRGRNGGKKKAAKDGDEED